MILTEFTTGRHEAQKGRGKLIDRKRESVWIKNSGRWRKMVRGEIPKSEQEKKDGKGVGKRVRGGGQG